MTANPIDLVGGLISAINVVKTDLVAWVKGRVPQVLADATELRNTTLAGQRVVTLIATGGQYRLDTSDTTTADDGVACIVSADGYRFKFNGYLVSTNNLAEIASASAARLNLGINQSIALPSGTDLNSVTTAGSFYTIDGTSPNAPTAQSYYLRVELGLSGAIKQTATAQDDGSSKTYVRTKEGGSWLAWRRQMAGNQNLSEITNAATARSNIGAALAPTTYEQALGADVTMTTQNTVYTAASVAPGATGVFLVRGYMTLVDPVGSAKFIGRITDGTTVLAACSGNSVTGSANLVLPISKIVTNPAGGTIYMQAVNTTRNGGTILWNSSGLGVGDTRLEAVRIA